MARKDRSTNQGIPSAAVGTNNVGDTDNPELQGTAGQDSQLPVDAGNAAIDPATADAAGTSTGRGSRRSRNSGTRSSGDDKRESRLTAKRERSKEAAKDLGVFFASTHWFMAAVSKCPELNITETDANKMGEALQRVNDLYDGAVMSPKVAAWYNLAMAMGGVYVPMFITIKAKKKMKKNPAPTLSIVQPQNTPEGIS
jgi:hypothetical protein